MHAEIIVLRLLHILSGIFWVGTTIFTSFFLLPALGSAGPAAGAVMAGLQRRRFMIWVPAAAVLAIVTGLRLLAIASGGFTAAYFRSTTGLTFAVSGALALVGLILGLTIVRPAAARAGELGGQLATAAADSRAMLGAELERLRARAASWSLAVVGLLLLASAGMAVARYLP